MYSKYVPYNIQLKRISSLLTPLLHDWCNNWLMILLLFVDVQTTFREIVDNGGNDMYVAQNRAGNNFLFFYSYSILFRLTRTPSYIIWLRVILSWAFNTYTFLFKLVLHLLIHKFCEILIKWLMKILKNFTILPEWF